MEKLPSFGLHRYHRSRFNKDIYDSSAISIFLSYDMSAQPTVADKAQEAVAQLASTVQDTLNLGSKDETKSGELHRFKYLKLPIPPYQQCTDP